RESQKIAREINRYSRALSSSSSRKSGCAIEISARARSGTDLPLRLTIPYSVTTYITSVRGVVTILQSSIRATILLARRASRSKVEARHRNDLPSREAYAPRTNCSCPPVPLICRTPADSEHACPVRSICAALQIEMTRSLSIMRCGRLVESTDPAKHAALRSRKSYIRFEPAANVYAIW